MVMAVKKLKLAHPGRILREEFMEPAGLSVYALAPAERGQPTRGRPTVVDEIKRAHADLRTYIASEFTTLLAEADFVDALPGHLLADDASQRR
jgi:hypothetical protein